MKQAMDMAQLMVDFDTEPECRAYLEELRWPDGISCPRCGGKTISRIRARDQFDCDSCRYQFSVMSGTIFHDSHLPLPKWFIATFLLCESRKGMSANQMKRILGVSYKTAWYLCHRIRAAMKEADGCKLTGTVEIDETYIGGKQAGHDRQLKNKSAVIGIRERGGHLHFIKANEMNQNAVYDIIAKNVDRTVDVIITDESKLAFSLLEHGIVGSWHRMSAKHLPAYLNEMTFRFNNRKNPFLFRDTMLRLVAAPNLEYKALVA